MPKLYWLEGWWARLTGRSIMSNPYLPNTRAKHDWLAGWNCHF
jgi:ribosome modulation factor